MKSSNQIILTTRARIARNIASHRFSSINNNAEKKDILNLVKNVFFNETKSKYHIFYSINKLTRTQRQFLIEKHLMSSEMNTELYGKGLIVNSDPDVKNKSISIMINEEDHLRIQCIKRGLKIYESYKEIFKIEKNLEKKIRFAYDKDFGYLTSCPTNLGTALRISIIAHLPALVVSSRIEGFIKNLSKIGCSIRGFFGENSEVIGNLFQISNQISLGKYEEQIIEEMNAICLNIIEEENKAKYFLMETKPAGVEDSVYRSYGMVKYAKMLSYGESLELLSMLKLGLDLGIINNIRSFDFYDLIRLLGESNILLNFVGTKSKDVKNEEIDKIRADLVKEKILKGIDANV
jgi:protein arginine kinase